MLVRQWKHRLVEQACLRRCHMGYVLHFRTLERGHLKNVLSEAYQKTLSYQSTFLVQV